MSWDSIKLPRSLGGLYIRDFKLVNCSLNGFENYVSQIGLPFGTLIVSNNIGTSHGMTESRQISPYSMNP